MSRGTITDVAGVSVGVAAGGIKYLDRDDVLVIVGDGVAAAVVTNSTALAAPCAWTRARVPGPCRAVVVNSGNANASTGEQGIEDVEGMAATAAEVLGCDIDEVLVCSTGVIGVPMPMEVVLPAVAAAAGDLGQDGDRAAQAILTTDLVTKQMSTRIGPVTVGGIAKGSGMLHPDMATMLAFVATDAAVEPEHLQGLVERIAEVTFNAVTVDGDTSTNDTFILQATGHGPPAHPGTPEWDALEAATRIVCTHLAREMARDGEGATKLITVRVTGLADDVTARAAARAVARSPLVKTAIHGCDANWGRVVGALGAFGAEGIEAMDLDFAGMPVLRSGKPMPFDEQATIDALDSDEVIIHARFPGPGQGVAWGCDLSEGYIQINAEYRS